MKMNLYRMSGLWEPYYVLRVRFLPCQHSFAELCSLLDTKSATHSSPYHYPRFKQCLHLQPSKSTRKYPTWKRVCIPSERRWMNWKWSCMLGLVGVSIWRHDLLMEGQQLLFQHGPALKVLCRSNPGWSESYPDTNHYHQLNDYSQLTPIEVPYILEVLSGRKSAHTLHDTTKLKFQTVMYFESFTYRAIEGLPNPYVDLPQLLSVIAADNVLYNTYNHICNRSHVFRKVCFWTWVSSHIRHIKAVVHSVESTSNCFEELS